MADRTDTNFDFRCNRCATPAVRNRSILRKKECPGSLELIGSGSQCPFVNSGGSRVTEPLAGTQSGGPFKHDFGLSGDYLIDTLWIFGDLVYGESRI